MPPISVMIKPASGLCNLRCEYCFYRNVTELRELSSLGKMSPETAEEIIRKALAFANGKTVAFAFQGGEPLLAGLPFFRHFIDTLHRENTKNSPIVLGLQTNGTLITDEWARFFRDNQILVGLSLDGDTYGSAFRLDTNGKNVVQKVLSAAERLKKHDVEFNILTVLTGRCADSIDRIYSFFKNKGFRYLQFIPCLRPFGDNSENELYMTNEQYAAYLTKCFRRYVQDYTRGQYTSIRYFDNLVHLYLNMPAEQCGMYGHCMHQFVAEGNGNIYPCDFYCTDEWLLGNIHETDFEALAKSERAVEFIRESLVIPEKCKECPYYFLCRSCGCKRTRADRDYCEAYQIFFKECLPLFQVFRVKGGL